MTPLALMIENFRSFKGQQKFDFPSQPGLYFMQGVNEVEPRLGGNACGKTTIWEALTWCLYGVTSDGLKAGDVCNWHASKGVKVAFVFLAGNGEPCKIERTWGPISWTLHDADDDRVIDLTKDASNPVLALLRLELEPWLNAVVTAQDRPMFLDLKQEAQAGLFSEVMGLERWVEYSQRASKKASAQDGITRELEREYAKLSGELEALLRQDFSEAHDDWEIARAKKLLGLEHEHKEGMAKREKLKAELAVAQEAEGAAREKVRAEPADPELGPLYREMKREHRELEDKLLQEKQALSAIQSHLDALTTSGKCPTCGHGLSHAEVREEERKAVRAVEAVEAMIRKLKDLEARVAKSLDELGEKLEKEGDRLEANQRRQEDAARAVSGARRALELQDRELDRIEERAEELEREANPYKEMARQATRNASRLRAALGAVQERLDASNARYALLSYWVRGFKELRLQQIAEALTELEIEVNSAVTALGLVDWELRFAVDKEGKGGGIQRGFNVMVRSPHNPQPTPWKAWSGGEKQRLRLAGNMGLADLIRNRTGTALNLEVWDEPTKGLSPQGIHDLLESLKARALREGRTIFVTDHKAHDFGGFAGTATIYKRPSGSKAVTTWSAV